MLDDKAQDGPGAAISFDDRASDSPLIERVWRSASSRGGLFLSVASPHWELVVTRLQGQTTVTLRGPETKPTWAHCPQNGEWLGVRFKLGTSLRDLPVPILLDRNDVTLPTASSNSFWLDGARWDIPEFENVETFVARLANEGLILRDPLVEAALQGDHQALSHRTAQRRFLRATGMTQTKLQLIARARHATTLLRTGMPIAEVAQATGFFDQAHLTHSLRRLIGQTPASIARGTEQLSFLYNTSSAD